MKHRKERISKILALSWSSLFHSRSASVHIIPGDKLHSLIWYSGRRITLSSSYVTEREEGKMERARGSKTARSLSSMYSVTENIFTPFNFDKIGGILIH
jgi:hypothetical protein